MELVKTFRFEAAHWLPNVPTGHKCGRPHGHSYEIGVHVTGPVDQDHGWVVDFGDISTAVKPVVAELDHACLNDLPGLENPTSELLAQWLWHRFQPVVALLTAVTVRETATSMCVFRGPTS
jgi:6-pyruvoyltetrahydropterin/6-carboxytetrahydropterin synthase